MTGIIADGLGQPFDTLLMMQYELIPVRPDDTPAVHDLIRRWETHWDLPIVTSLEEVGEDLEGPHFHLDLDTRCVWVGDRLAAFARVRHTPSGERLERALVTGLVDPDLRGNGIGRRLLAWQVERATEKLRDCDPALPWYIRTHEWESVEDSIRLHHRFGFRTVRWFEDMIRPLDDALEVSTPAGVELVPWDVADTDDLRLVLNAAFADHWGSTPRDAASWEHILAGSTTRTDLSYVALVEGRPVGCSLNAHYPTDETVTGRKDGWIEILGVVREWRKRGIAGALIARSVEAFRQAGFTHAMLGVDTDNPTGAGGLYAKLGFRPLHRTVADELSVPH